MHGGCYNTNNGVETLYFVHNLALLCTYMYCKESEEIKCEKAVDFYLEMHFAKKYACALNMKQTFVEQLGKKFINYFTVVGIAIMVVF